MIKVIFIKKVSPVLWEMEIANTAQEINSSVYARKKSDLLRYAKDNNYQLPKQ